MCGRFVVVEKDQFYPHFRVSEAEAVNMNWSYNLAPSQFAGVITKDEEGENHIEAMKWGIQPQWAAKNKDIKLKPINARVESVASKPFFRSAFTKRRCVVPASGFYEWQKNKEGKRPHYIYLEREPYMSFAGIYEEWKDSEGEPHKTFAIITIPAGEFMKPIHDRMPAIINDREDDWLNPKNTDKEAMQILLKEEMYDEELAEYEVSTEVNSPKNNSKTLIAELDRK